MMNFITHERAYCLYPLETIARSRTLVLADYTEQVYQEILTYTEQGFNFLQLADGEDFEHQKVRWVEDQYSWIVSFNDMNMSYAENFQIIEPIRLTTWSIATAPRNLHRVHFYILYGEENSPVYPFLVATTQLKTRISIKWTDLVRKGKVSDFTNGSKE